MQGRFCPPKKGNEKMKRIYESDISNVSFACDQMSHHVSENELETFLIDEAVKISFFHDVAERWVLEDINMNRE